MIDGKLDTKSGQAMFWFLILSDFVPYFTILCTMWLSGKNQINLLVCGFLYKPGEEDKTTVIGSCMFQELQEEIANMSDHINFRSQMFDSSDESSSG